MHDKSIKNHASFLYLPKQKKTDKDRKKFLSAFLVDCSLFL